MVIFHQKFEANQKLKLCHLWLKGDIKRAFPQANINTSTGRYRINQSELACYLNYLVTKNPQLIYNEKLLERKSIQNSCHNTCGSLLHGNWLTNWESNLWMQYWSIIIIIVIDHTVVLMNFFFFTNNVDYYLMNWQFLWATLGDDDQIPRN